MEVVNQCFECPVDQLYRKYKADSDKDDSPPYRCWAQHAESDNSQHRESDMRAKTFLETPAFGNT